MFRRYWSVVLQRAWKSTRHDFRLETNPRIFVAILIWIIVSYLAFQSNPNEFSFVQTIQNAAKWLAAISLLSPIWFIGRILVSSSDIYRELIQTIKKLESEKNNKDSIKSALNDLVDISSKLKILFSTAVNTDAQLDKIRDEYYLNIKEACSIIQSHISESKAKIFAVTPTVTDGIFRGSYNTDHNYVRLVLDKRVNQLNEIITQYDTR